MGSINELVKSIRHEQLEIEEEKRTILLESGLNEISDDSEQINLAEELIELKLKVANLERKIAKNNVIAASATH